MQVKSLIHTQKNLLSLVNRYFSTGASIVKPRVTQLLIDGKFVNSVSGKTFETLNPSTEEPLAQIQEADQRDVDIAVKAARKAFDHGTWRRADHLVRRNVLLKIADNIEKNIVELAQLEALDNGKPFSHAIMDVGFSLEILKYYAGWTDKIMGDTIPISGPYFCYTREEPVGVCGQIVPWNFPFLMSVFKIAPALACGNTVVLKPAEQTPLTALRLGELIMESGVPEGVVNILPGFGETAGDALVRHRGVDKIAFTGSTDVGRKIISNGGIKRVSLELGGKNPLIVLNDADLDNAVMFAHLAAFVNSGQACLSGSRTYV